ncbi:MAG TPA: TrmH family RNA methyltransferase, partial [Saprospiraceae bacterium]|nr:TrmH family RNA methyltransferase [Saprospiraceae bacterium]
MKQKTYEVLNRYSVEEFKRLKKLPVVIVLDNLRSGLNIGSAFRTADAFAVSSIELCGICAIPPNREILKTALGATESVQWRYHDSTKDC